MLAPNVACLDRPSSATVSRHCLGRVGAPIWHRRLHSALRQSFSARSQVAIEHHLFCSPAGWHKI